MFAILDLLFRSFSEGGSIMLPVALLTLLWLGALVTEFLRKPLCRHPLAYLMFPIGFLCLAMLKLSLCMLRLSTSVKIAGWPDMDQVASDGLVHSRALIWISSLAILSLLSAVVVMFCRGEKRRTKPGV